MTNPKAHCILASKFHLIRFMLHKRRDVINDESCVYLGKGTCDKVNTYPSKPGWDSFKNLYKGASLSPFTCLFIIPRSSHNQYHATDKQFFVHTYSLAVRGKLTSQLSLQKFWISSSLPGSGYQTVLSNLFQSCITLYQIQPQHTLTGKLVARTSNNSKATILVFLVKLFQTRVLLGEATLGRDIDNQNDLLLGGGPKLDTHSCQDTFPQSTCIVLQCREIPVLVLDVFNSKLEKVGHCRW